MNALFEDGGKFHAGRVMSETDTSLQIELASGKRSKVKAANVLLRFADPEPEGCSARPSGSRARSTSTWRGSSRPRATSLSPSWRATTSAPRPT